MFLDDIAEGGHGRPNPRLHLDKCGEAVARELFEIHHELSDGETKGEHTRSSSNDSIEDCLVKMRALRVNHSGLVESRILCIVEKTPRTTARLRA